MIIGVFAILLAIAGTAAGYILFVRPMLRQWASLKDFWSSADAIEMSIWKKVQVFFEGIKIKLLARLVWVPTLLVEAYDRLGPYIAGADFTPLTAQLPPLAQSALPIVSAMVLPMLIDIARSYSNQPAS